MGEIALPESDYPRVVVVGGGFGGIALASALADEAFQVVLLDKNNFHQFQPLLYQVATCGLEPDSIIFPLRKIFERCENIRFRMAEVECIDVEAKTVHTNVGTVAFDKLVLATGSTSNFFGNEEIERRSTGMKDIREALDIRSLILQNFERASVSRDAAERDALTNFCVVGGGPAGVETVGALAEFRRYILERDYPDLDPELMRIFLVQSGGQLLKGMSDESGIEALRDLVDMGVEVILNERVASYDGLTVRTKDGLELSARTMIWTAGVRGELPDGVGEHAITRGGRISVDAFNAIDGHPNVYAVGDVASMVSDDWPHGHPMVAPAAIQQGRHLAKNFLLERKGEDARPFRYVDKGSLATIGKRRAVADLGEMRLRGFPAWVIWCFVHVLSLIGFRNKFMVFTNWLMSYFTYEKGNRFIVREPPELK